MWEEGWWVIQDVAVTPCEGRVSRNGENTVARKYDLMSRPARGV